jgi:hypothetical protein
MRNILLLGAAMVFAAGLAGAWDMGDPIVTYWAGPGFPGDPKLTDASLKQLKEAGFNLTWATTPEELDIAQRNGFRVLYCNGDINNPAALTDPAAAAKLKVAVDAVKAHPALSQYFITDEPPATKFAQWAGLKALVNKADPAHSCYLNLLPTYASNNQLGVKGEIIHAYADHLRLFAQIFQPDMLSYDHYQFNNSNDTPNYFLNLSMIRDSAAAQGIPFMNIVQGCTWVPGSAASPSAPRIPKPNELRYLVYTSAAYGARAISYYVYSHAGHEGTIVGLDGKPSENYFALKTLNREFVAIAKELTPLRFVGAYHNGTQSPGVTPYCDAAVLKLSPDMPAKELVAGQRLTDTVLVSRFDRPGATAPDGSCFLVVNLDYKAPRTVTVTVPLSIERFDALGAKWGPAQGESVKLDLLPGGGALLRIKK